MAVVSFTLSLTSNNGMQGRDDEIKLTSPSKPVDNQDTPVFFMIPAQCIFRSGKSPVGMIPAIRIY